MHSRDEALKVLGEVYESCNAIYNNNIKDAFLYGSYARGDFHEESDIDIFLAVDMPNEDIALQRRKIAGISSNLSLKHDITVSVTVKSFEQFKTYANILPYYQPEIQKVQLIVRIILFFMQCVHYWLLMRLT